MSGVDDVIVGGIRTTRLSRVELTKLMVRDCLAARTEKHRPRLIFDLNGHGLALAKWDRSFRRDLIAADLIHADGQAIVMASRLLTQTPISERSATTDFFHDAAPAAIEHNLRVFLLGAKEDVNRACAAEMMRLYPGLQIVGRRNGYFSEAEEPAICEQINASGADIVWVGLGKPKEQAFCIRNRDRLRAGWLITCGGCFNYIVGTYQRAPAWVQEIGLEWLVRAILHPRQVAWRYITSNPIAIYLLLTQTRSIAHDGTDTAGRKSAGETEGVIQPE